MPELPQETTDSALPVTLTPQEQKDRQRNAALEAIKEDPFGGYSWILSSMDKILALSAAHYEYLPIETASKWMAEYWVATAHNLPTVLPDQWDKGLRAYILGKLPELIDECTRCELAQNRIPGRGACSHEGTVNADIFICGEGPGAFEQRTKVPADGKD